LDVAEGVSQGSSCLLTNTVVVSSNSWAEEIAAIDRAALAGDQTSGSSPDAAPQTCVPLTISEPVGVQALSENVDCGILVRGIISDVAEVAHSGHSCLMSCSCVSEQAGGEQNRHLEQDLGERAPMRSSQDTQMSGTESLSELIDVRRRRPGEGSATSLLPAPRLVDVADVLAVAPLDTELEESPRITTAYQLEACCTEAVQENSRLLEENEQLRRELDMLLAMTSPLDTASSVGSTASDSKVAK